MLLAVSHNYIPSVAKGSAAPPRASEPTGRAHTATPEGEVIAPHASLTVSSSHFALHRQGTFFRNTRVGSPPRSGRTSCTAAHGPPAARTSCTASPILAPRRQRAFFCSTRTTHLGSPPLRPYTPPALQCFGGLPSAAVGHLFRTAGEWEAFSTSCWKPFSPFWTLRRSWPPRALRRPTSGAPRDHPAYPSVCRVPSFLQKQDRLRAQDLLTTSLDHYVPTYHYIPYTLSTLGGE